MTISLWDLHRLGDLPTNDRIYDETFLSVQIFNYREKQDQRVISSSCKFLFAPFRSLKKAHKQEKGVKLIFGATKCSFITRQCALAIVTQLLQSPTNPTTKFKLKIFTGVEMNWASLKSLRFPKRRRRALTWLHSYHVGYMSLPCLRLERNFFI